MMTGEFFTNPQTTAPAATTFMGGAAAPAAPSGNYWASNNGQQGGSGAVPSDPRMGGATATMIYQQLGYWDGNPTEIDIFSDIIRAAAPVGRFLVTDQGFPALAQFLSSLIDYKLVNFFKEFKMGIVQDESGAMFLQPLPEQTTDEGKRLQTITMAEVATNMTAISEQLKVTLIAQADDLLSKHRQAAQMRAAQTGFDGILADAVGGEQSGGGLSRLVSGVVNTGMRAVGVPVPPVAQPSPPPPFR
jgi:hypothetical protein